MPDLQSELKKTLNAWEQDANQYQPDLQPKEQMKMQATFATAARPATPATPATNKPESKTSTLPKPVKPADMTLTETVFNFVRDNPGHGSMDYVFRFVDAGFNYGSISSLLSQFVHVRMINKDVDGKLTVAVSEYKNLTGAVRQMQKRKRVVLVKRKPTDTKQPAGIAALPKPLKKEDFIITKAKPEPVAPAKDKEWSADAILDNLSVKQARQLRDALNEMFKG